MRTLANTAQSPEPGLLARIVPFQKGSLEKCLIYPADAPTGTLRKFERFLLTPLMRWEARHQVCRFLESEEIQKLDSAKSLSNILKKDIFRAVTASELSAVLAEASLRQIPVNGRLSPLTKAFFENPANLERACGQLQVTTRPGHQQALEALIRFAKDPQAQLNRRDAHPVRMLIQQLDTQRLPAALCATLTDIAEKYFDAQQALRGFGNDFGSTRKETLLAFDELHACLPLTEKSCVEAFERFAVLGRISGDDRSFLQQVLPLLARNFARLSGDSLRFLLPHVAAVEDSLAEQNLFDGFHLSEKLSVNEHALAFALILSVKDDTRSYSQASALALIEYITTKRHIKILEADIARSKKLLDPATLHASALFEKQKLSALMKRRLPNRKRKKSALAYKGVWNASTQNIKRAEEQLSSLQRSLINPEAQVRLTYVAMRRDQLMQCLPSSGKKMRTTADQVLKELTEDLKKLNAANDKPVG